MRLAMIAVAAGLWLMPAVPSLATGGALGDSVQPTDFSAAKKDKKKKTSKAKAPKVEYMRAVPTK